MTILSTTPLCSSFGDLLHTYTTPCEFPNNLESELWESLGNYTCDRIIESCYEASYPLQDSSRLSSRAALRLAYSEPTASVLKATPNAKAVTLKISIKVADSNA
jgi:hypothetical protein